MSLVSDGHQLDVLTIAPYSTTLDFGKIIIIIIIIIIIMNGMLPLVEIDHVMRAPIST